MDTRKDIEKKCKLCRITFLIAFGFSIAFLVAGFLVPPKGIIDPSVLKGVAELFAFAALAFGGHALTLGYDLKIAKGDTTIDVNNNHNQ